MFVGRHLLPPPVMKPKPSPRLWKTGPRQSVWADYAGSRISGTDFLAPPLFFTALVVPMSPAAPTPNLFGDDPTMADVKNEVAMPPREQFHIEPRAVGLDPPLGDFFLFAMQGPVSPDRALYPLKQFGFVVSKSTAAPPRLQPLRLVPLSQISLRLSLLPDQSAAAIYPAVIYLAIPATMAYFAIQLAT